MSTTAIHVPAGWYSDPIETATTGIVAEARRRIGGGYRSGHRLAA